MLLKTSMFKPPVVGNINYRDDDLSLYMAGTSAYNGTHAINGKNAGKLYYEVNINSVAPTSIGAIGITREPKNILSVLAFGYNQSEYSFLLDGTVMNNYSGRPYSRRLKNGDVLGIAIDLDNFTLTFYLDNISLGVAFNLPRAEYFPAFNMYLNGVDITFNFGNTAFKYDIPEGFVPYDSKPRKYLIISDNIISSIKFDVELGIYQLVQLSYLNLSNLTDNDISTLGFDRLDYIFGKTTIDDTDIRIINSFDKPIQILTSK